MLIDTLNSLFTRDLKRLRTEIEMYRNEENIWKVKGNITNSAGNLCLHLIGNLNTYIGNEISKTGYARNRESEFSLRNIPKAELLDKIDNTIDVINVALHNLNESDLDLEFPILVFDEKTSVAYLLMHLTTHLTYHLGQINYHRRFVDI